MNAINLNAVLDSCGIAEHLRHAIVLVAHLLIMAAHGPAECTPLEAQCCGKRAHRTSAALSRSL